MDTAENTGDLVRSFANDHGLRKVKRDDCGDWNIFGHRGDIYEYDDRKRLLAVTILRCPNKQHWDKYRKLLKAAGCEITQNGDTEGTAVFSVSDEKQVKIAIEAIRPYRKRNMTPELLAKLAEVRAKSPLIARAQTSEEEDEDLLDDEEDDAE